MSIITESAVEAHAIYRLDEQDYTYLPRPNIAPDGDTPMLYRYFLKMAHLQII